MTKIEINKDVSILTWVFFGSNGITDNVDLTRCNMLCMEIVNYPEKTIEEIKKTSGYLSCIHDIPSHLISDEKLLEIKNWRL